MYAACPFCRQTLNLRPEHIGVALQCPNCKGTFAIQGNAVEEEASPAGITPAVLWTIVIAGHVTALIVFAIPLGAGLSAFLVGAAVVVELCIWQWPRLLR